MIPSPKLYADETRSSTVDPGETRSSSVDSGNTRSSTSGDDPEDLFPEMFADSADTTDTTDPDTEPVALSVTVSGDFQVKNGKLIKYTGTDSSVTIPSQIKEIAESAFEGNTTLHSVTAMEGLTRIGYRAFADCTALNSVTLPDSVKSIGNFAFQGDRALSSFRVGTGLTELGSGVFGGCTSLGTVTFDNSLDKRSAFVVVDGAILNRDTANVLYAYLPGAAATSYSMPESVDRIMDYAFYGAIKLNKISFSPKVRKIPSYAFSHCTGLESVTIPAAASSLEMKSFENCVSLTYAYIPPGVSFIHPTAFDGCYQLYIDADRDTAADAFAADFTTEEPIGILPMAPSNSHKEDEDGNASPSAPSGLIDGNTRKDQSPGVVTEARDISQYGVSASLRVGGSTSTSGNVTGRSRVLGGRVYVGMDGSGVYGTPASAEVQNPPGESNVVFEGTAGNLNTGSKGTVYSGNERGDAGEARSEDNADKWTSLPKYTTSNGIIAKTAFYGDRSLTDYDFTEGRPIKEIGELAFARSGLTHVEIPQTVTKIDYGAFYHADNLEEIRVPKSVNEIAPKAFDHTPYLKRRLSETDFIVEGNGILILYGGNEETVELPGDVKIIGPEAFVGNTAIKKVVLPDSVRIVGEAAFSGCSNLEAVEGGRNVHKIADRAFSGCTSLSYTLPDNIGELGLGAFANVKEVSVKRSLPKLSHEASAEKLANSAYRIPVFYGAGVDGVDKEGYTKPFETEGDLISINTSLIKGAKASLSGADANDYQSVIGDGEREKLNIAFSWIYGNSLPENAVVLDIGLTDKGTQVPITQFGRGKLMLNLTLADPEIGEGGFHVVTLDADGQLEALPVEYNEETGEVSFDTSHLSVFAIYRNEKDLTVTSEGHTISAMAGGPMDETPETGDHSVDPKWFLMIGLFSAGLALLVATRKS